MTDPYNFFNRKRHVEGYGEMTRDELRDKCIEMDVEAKRVSKIWLNWHRSEVTNELDASGSGPEIDESARPDENRNL